MNKFKFWIPCLIGAILTPLFFCASTVTGNGAASHAGGGLQIILFYPLPLFLAILLGARLTDHSFYSQIGVVVAIGMAIIQFPLFGFLIAYTNLKKGMLIFILLKIIVAFHIFVSILGLLLVLITILN